jgi:hypothetical protein
MRLPIAGTLRFCFSTIASILTLVVFAQAACSDAIASHEEELRERLMEQAPSSLKRIAEAFKIYKAKVTAERIIDGKNFRVQQSMTLKRKNERVLAEIEDVNAGSRVFCINPSYSFQLKDAQKSNTDLKWMIVDAGPNYASSASLPSRIDGMSYGIFSSPTHIAGLPLHHLLGSNGFIIGGIEECLEIDGHSCVRIKFDYSPTAGETLLSDSVLDATFAGPPAITGQVTVLPELGWLIVGSDIKATYNIVGKGKTKPVHSVTKIDYDLGSQPDKVYFPIRFSQTIVNPNNQLSAKIDCTVNDLSTEKLSDSEFMLGAYGLPELTLRPKPVQFGWYALMFATVCIAFAIILWWYNSRRLATSLQR